MNKIENTYLSIANNDYLYLLKHEDKDFRNNNAVICEQVIEKLFKSIIEIVLPDNKNLLKSHNLRNLYLSIKDEIKLDRFYIAFLSTISDFYFDTRYPGDDFTIVNEEDWDTCLEVMNEVHKLVNEWHNKRSKSVLDAMVDIATK